MDLDRELVVIVPVRGGSKGFPGKNTALVGGEPLYLRAVLQGQRICKKVIVTTDIEEVFERKFPSNVTVIRRSAALASDEARMATVINSVIQEQNLHDSIILLLQATSPLRLDSDIEQCLRLYSSGKYDIVFSVTKKSSSIYKYGRLNGDRFYPIRSAHDCFENRQNLPEVFAPNGAVYVFGAASFLCSGDFPTGSIGAYEMPESRSIDIDAKEDLDFVNGFLNDVN